MQKALSERGNREQREEAYLSALNDAVSDIARLTVSLRKKTQRIEIITNDLNVPESLDSNTKALQKKG